MKISQKMTRKQFAAAVVRQLEKRNISCVLVGGACVSIYTNEKHHSHDLDFISPNSQESIREALVEIGFVPEKRYFKHPNSDFYVEFPRSLKTSPEISTVARSITKSAETLASVEILIGIKLGCSDWAVR